jgi:hypothetical protein
MTSSPVFGVGAQVFVRDVSASDRSSWPTSPSGVIVGAGGSPIQGVWGSAMGGRMWNIEFDEPQIQDDGAGPFDSAQINERYLELAPPID